MTFFSGTATYYYGASDHIYRSFMAPYLLQWTAIRAAKQRGLRVYDFLGIAPENQTSKHSLDGVTSFKRKFGGRVAQYLSSSELVLSSRRYKLLIGLKHVRKKLF